METIGATGRAGERFARPDSVVPGDFTKKTPSWSWFAVLKIAVVVVAVVPVGLALGTLLGIIEDFGLSGTVENIRHNPGTFANQFARNIAFTGWAALVAIVVLFVAGGVVLIRRYGSLSAKDRQRYHHASGLKEEAEAIASTGGPGGPPMWPRFSRLAIVGAVWAPSFFLMVPAYFLGSFSVPPAGPEPLPAPPLQQQALGMLVMLLVVVIFASAVTAPFGTTILGAVSISQIRHSAGRLYGLGLALFDAMLFPLLLLDAVIVVVTGIALAFLLRKARIFIDPGEPGSLLIIVPVTLLALGIDYLIVRWAWRAVNRPVGASPGKAPPSAQQARPHPRSTDRRRTGPVSRSPGSRWGCSWLACSAARRFPP